VILDEGHAIRNPNAQQTKAVLDLEAERRWVLTGNCRIQFWGPLKISNYLKNGYIYYIYLWIPCGVSIPEYLI
jgi:hypothetical protein